MKITGEIKLDKKNWYMVISNHQSWLDIVVLQKIFNRKIPILKFFIKDKLKWVPILGFAWWALDFPFMKRYSRNYLEKKPHKKGEDLKTTQKACVKFKQTPTAIMNFVEGTRFTKEKHTNQDSPYRYLLKPKAGGLAFVVNSMGEQLHAIIDVTILYPHQKKSLWHYLCGQINEIKVHIRQIPIPKQFIYGDYFNDNELQAAFRQWLNQTWYEKDKLIEKKLSLTHS